MDNAVKYSPGGGDITCTVRRKGAQVYFSVRDEGVGIAPEHLPTLFTRFERLPTDANVTIPGTGLGLFLCREIVSRHGGDMTVRSAPGEGSEFTLTLPGPERVGVLVDLGFRSGWFGRLRGLGRGR
jgi:signal transduction histidine kinase